MWSATAAAVRAPSSPGNMTGMIGWLPGAGRSPLRTSACGRGCVALQRLPSLRRRRHQLESLQRSGDDGRRHRVREEVGPGALTQQVDDLLMGTHVATGRAPEGLPRVPVMMSTRSVTPKSSGVPPTGADEADGVTVVDQHHRLELVGEIADLVQGAKEPSIENTPSVTTTTRWHPRPARPPVAAQGPPCRRSCSDIWPPWTGGPVDDRGVVEFVADDRVTLAEEHLEDAAVGVEARRSRGSSPPSRGTH